ncbi:MAG: DsbA family protein [Sphingomonas phyllosphaerae]|uniref:DsbA family protein n=1 Tax=Sphingomonas phyllosphaerae TaxID=257003 RepID=UPI002FF4BBE5
MAGGAGWALGHLLARTAPAGRDVRASGAVAAILDDPDAPAIGPASASLRLAVFSDYRCPACRQGFPALTDAVADDGDVRLLFKDWPIFGGASVQAARIALASVSQGIYPEVHRRLMTTGGALGAAQLRAAVMASGGDWMRLLADLSTHGIDIDARLRRHAAEAASIALPGTPGYLAGSLLVVGKIDAAAFARLFAGARKGG